MDKTNMRFLFGDRELMLVAGDLLTAREQVIVCPNDSALAGNKGLALRIREVAGGQLAEQCEQLIREYGRIDEGMAVYTSAGELPYTAIIHAIGPAAGSDDLQHLLIQAISRSLQLCEMNEWQSVAFPEFTESCEFASIQTCAQAFYRAITHFWDARYDSPLEKVKVYVEAQRFRPFFDAFRAAGIDTDVTVAADGLKPDTGEEHTEVGQVTLSEADIDDLKDADIDDWFK